MATTMGARSRAEINMPPLIDVLLVLLIIFMVIKPPEPKGLDALVPQLNPSAAKGEGRSIVIQALAGNVLKINQEQVTEQDLGPRLKEIFKTRAIRICFVKGDDTLEFQEVARVIDIAKGAGVDKIALL